MKYYLAIDLGATSGRHIVGHEANGEIVLDEVHRFPNEMKETEDGLVWETDRLFNEIKIGIKKALEKYPHIESLAIDTWGVDYVLFKGDKDIKPHFAYRNDRVIKRVEEVHNIIPFEELYNKTGIQFAQFNTIYQLFDDLKKGRLNGATDFLMLPQYFSFLLTGVKKYEYTDFSTTGLLNAKTKDFDRTIINKLGLPECLFKKLDDPGTEVGFFKDEIAKEVGGQIKVVLAPSHDTASAFESVESPDDAAFLSSGTWSLLGYKLKEANTSLKSLKYNFTNEGGVGYIRFLKNIMGMWITTSLVKEIYCDYTLENIIKSVNEARSSSYEEIFDANDPKLTAPKSMKETILDLLKNNPPKTDGDLFRSAFLSLATCYSKTVKEIEDVLDLKINSIYIVGGGAKNNFLNEITEQISGKKVVAIPIEATAIGNLKAQIKANGKI